MTEQSDSKVVIETSEWTWGNLPPVLTRDEARANGSKFYFLGKACKKSGLPAVRKSSTGACHCPNCALEMVERNHDWHVRNKERKSEMGKAWYLANKAKKDAANKAWADANRERCKELSNAWYLENKERHAATGLAWRLANPEREKERSKEWYAANKARKLETGQAWRESNRDKSNAINARRRARSLKATPPDLTQFENDWITAMFWVADVLKKDFGQKFHLDHYLPVSRAEEFQVYAHHPNNLVVLPARENLSKAANVPPDALERASARPDFYKTTPVPDELEDLVKILVERNHLRGEHAKLLLDGPEYEPGLICEPESESEY